MKGRFDPSESEGHVTVRVGHSTLVYRDTPERIELYSIRTPKAHRGKGSASAALDALCALADRQGKTIRLLASPLDKSTAIRKLVGFYRGRGFLATGERGNQAGDPWMERAPLTEES
jgi:GNAT superfamily N-acetyltransferase